MSLPARSTFQTVEDTLAIGVFVVVAVLATDFPVQYPVWPTLAWVPIDPELVVPGLLGLVALCGAVADGLGVWSAVVGVLGFGTLTLAAVSLHALYAGTAGGVFGGGILTLGVGIPLALVVCLRAVVRTVAPDGARTKLAEAR